MEYFFIGSIIFVIAVVSWLIKSKPMKDIE